MTAVVSVTATPWDPNKFVNPAAGLADVLPMFSLDVVSVVAGYLEKQNYAYCGREDWEGLFGRESIGVVPKWPDDLEEELSKECPFNKGQQIWQTHELMLFVQRVNGTLLESGKILEIFKKAHGVLDKKPELRKNLVWEFGREPPAGLQAASPSYWGLVCHHIAGTQHQTHAEQEDLLKQAGKSYRITSVCEQVQYDVMRYIRTGAFTKGNVSCRERDFRILMCESFGKGLCCMGRVTDGYRISAVRAFPLQNS